MVRDSSHKRIYGLIGYPVKHSFSPAMHNAAFHSLNINAEYRLFPLKENELKGFFAGLKKNNIFGLNVTIPYKEKVIAFLDKISLEAKLIRAVNTIRFSQNRLEGFNTDGAGFLKHLTEDLRFAPGGKNIAMLGAGGAARAVCVYLSKEKPRIISIYDIDKPKAKALIKHLKECFNNIEFKAADSVEELNIGSCDLLINASPIGMQEADPCLVDEKFIHKDILVYDVIYNPKETKLLKMARKKGAKISNGLGMLLYQGVHSFELWIQKPAPVEVMSKALEEAINK
ncbi:MAG: shikimate dehydrogenase [Candidatus Omnitrophota bacterium]|nr:shikimate dehydrogenase [Candidatus Omnitrophota bacterium]